MTDDIRMPGGADRLDPKTMDPAWLHRQLCSFESHMALDQYVGQPSTYALPSVVGVVLRTGRHFMAELPDSIPQTREVFSWWARHGAAMCLVAFEAWQTTLPATDAEQVRALKARMAQADVEQFIAQLPPDDREEILVVSGVTPRRLWVRTRRITRPRTGSARLGPVEEGNPTTVTVKAFANLPWGTEPLPANFPPSGPCPHCGGSPDHDDADEERR